MKNKDFIRIVNTMNPDKNQKEKMLEHILNQSTKYHRHSLSWLGMLAMSAVCLTFIIHGHFQGIVNMNPYEPRAYQQAYSEFYYQNNWYQERGEIKKRDDFIYLATIVEKGETVDIYQGLEEDSLVLKKRDSYYLYQLIK